MLSNQFRNALHALTQYIIRSGYDMTMSEIQEAAEVITNAVSPDANIIFGASSQTRARIYRLEQTIIRNRNQSINMARKLLNRFLGIIRLVGRLAKAGRLSLRSRQLSHL